jgi:hypothetical protein
MEVVKPVLVPHMGVSVPWDSFLTVVRETDSEAETLWNLLWDHLSQKLKWTSLPLGSCVSWYHSQRGLGPSYRVIFKSTVKTNEADRSFC